MPSKYPGGFSPRVPHRSGREPLYSSGSCHPTKGAAFHQDEELLRLSVDSIPMTVACSFAPRELPHFLTTTKQSVPGRCIGTFGVAGTEWLRA